MTRAPVVERVLKALEWSIIITSHGDNYGRAWKSARIDYDAAAKCATLADLLACKRPAVRSAARHRARPGPEVERVVKALRMVADVAEATFVAARKAKGVAKRGSWHIVAAAEDIARSAAGSATADFRDACGCQTLADLLTCDRSDVRLAAMLTPEPAPPAPKRKRKR